MKGAALISPRPKTAEKANQGPRTAFLRALFCRLDEEGVRYCVLHSWQDLPEVLTSDLDLAVEEHEQEKVQRVIRSLDRDGFRLIQIFNYAVGGYYFVFVWRGEPRGIAVDFAFRHQRSFLDFGSGSELTRGRLRYRDLMWVAAPDVEFRYLLVKKILKGSLPQHQAKRIRDLTLQIGRGRAEEVVAALLGRCCAKDVVECCLDGRLQSRLAGLGLALWWRTCLRAPVGLLQNLLTDGVRRIRRLLRPTGVFVAVYGPDGAGKSTLAQNLIANSSPAFRRSKLYHWRPMLLRGSRDSGPVVNPHARAVHSKARSVLRLCYHLLDYWVGYLFSIYPQVSRSGLVMFDRYVGDLSVDPVRYRYGGPAWLVRALQGLAPHPDMSFVLDLDSESIKSRKQEVTPEEMLRQRQAYRELAHDIDCKLVDAKGSRADVYIAVLTTLHSHLAERLRRRHRWLEESNRPACDSKGQAALQCCVDRFCDAAQGLTGVRSRVLSFARAAAFSRLCASAGMTHLRQFAVLPNCGAPRLLVPVENAKAARSTLRHYSAYSARARATRLLLSRTAGTAKFWPADHLVIGSDRRLALDELIEQITGESGAELAISIGAPGRYQKMTVQVMSHEGEVFGFIKLPLAPASAERIHHEAKILTELWGHKSLQPHIPQVKYAGSWQDGYLLFESALPGKKSAPQFLDIHRRFLEALWEAAQSERSAELVLDEVEQDWNSAAPYFDTGWRQLGSKALQRARVVLRGLRLACGPSHGDFTPWNMKTCDDRLLVFDWESASWERPRLWDMFHFYTQSALILGRELGDRLPWRHSPEHQASFLLYLLASACRAFDEGHPNPVGVQGRGKMLALELQYC